MAARIGREGSRRMQQIVDEWRLAHTAPFRYSRLPSSTGCVTQHLSSLRVSELSRTASPAMGVRTAAPRYERRGSGGPLAAFLSFLVPGLGQAYNGQPLLAMLLAAPVVLIAALAGLAALSPNISVITHLLDIRFLVGLVVLDIALLGWRGVAILQAYVERRTPGRWSRGTYFVAGLLLVVVAMHAVPAAYAAKAIDTLNSVSQGGDGGGFSGDTGGGLGDGDSLPIPTDQPEVGSGERVNILLIGVDSGYGRNHALTDTMLVVSIDPDGTSAMLSVPRDLYGVPLGDGRTFNAKLNELLSTAERDAAAYPSGGVGTLKSAIGELLGLPIHYFAAVNLSGFKEAIDAIGGVDVTVERAIADPVYSEDGVEGAGFYIEAGDYHMDGSLALAYVRSRHGPGDNDFTRAERQQQLLTAVQEQLTAGNLLLSLSSLMDAVKNTIATDIPSNRISALAQAVQDTDTSQLARAVIQPPLVQPESHPVAGYILHPDLSAIRALVRDFVAGRPVPTLEP